MKEKKLDVIITMKEYDSLIGIRDNKHYYYVGINYQPWAHYYSMIYTDEKMKDMLTSRDNKIKELEKEIYESKNIIDKFLDWIKLF